MLLRNYDLMCALHQSTFTDKVIESIKAKIKNADGGSLNVAATGIYPLSSFVNVNNTPGKGLYNILVVGSNDTPVSYDDVKINLISGLTGVSITDTQGVLNEDENIFENVLKVVYNNGNNESVIIKEIGVYQGVSGTYATTAWQTLLYREVLETPIEVPSGASVTISFTKRVSLNTNQPADYVATASVE